MSIDTAAPSIFDAGLPTLTYDITATPQEIYPQFRVAQAAAPIALGRSDRRCCPTTSPERSSGIRASASRPAFTSPRTESPLESCGTG